MAVNFTFNLNLAKPTEAELARNLITGDELYADNNIILEEEMNKVLTPYTASLVATTANPNIGATGSAQGEYIEFEGIIQGSFIITFSGAGVAPGTGEYGVRLPFPVEQTVFHSVGNALNATPGGFHIIGEGFHYDASASATSGSFAIDAVTVGGISYARMLTEAFTAPVKTNRFVSANMPFTVADGDRLIGNFVYRQA